MSTPETQVMELKVLPGIERDGTDLDGGHYVDAQHVRFYRGKPRKMGGWRRVTDELRGPITDVNIWAQSTLNNITTFSTQGIESLLVDKEGVGASIINRDPAAFPTNTKLVWSSDVLYDSAAGMPGAVILAHGAYSLDDIEDQTLTAVYTGVAVGSSIFVAVAGITTSGGVLATHPFAVIYGSDGNVTWSNENEPNNYTTGSAGSTRATANKIVAGKRRAASTGPGAVLWSLDAVVAMSYVGGSAIFSFTEISTDSSILSSRSVVAYDGKYYWPGTDRFLVSDGASVVELPNQMNASWFYDNLNYTKRQKVWGVAVPRWGEIWWHFPYGNDATECNKVVVYNVRENTWYDTTLARSAGIRARVFRYPLMAGTTANTSGKYNLYTHEFGVDAIEGDDVSTIEAYVETCDIGILNGLGQEGAIGQNVNTCIRRVEPDFVVTGNMTMQATGNSTANSTVVLGEEHDFDSTTEVIDLREQYRHLRLKFSSGEEGGDFEMGKVLVHLAPGDART